MKHVFRTNELNQVKPKGLKFEPSNALGYSSLSKWPSDTRANDVKLELNKKFGLKIYLINKQGTILEEVNPKLLAH